MDIYNPPRFRRSRTPVARLSVSSLLIAVLASLASAGPSLGATPLQNGGFEQGDYYDPGSWQVVPAGDTSLTGWTVTQGSVDWVSSYWRAAEGAKSIDLNGNTPGGLSQTFSTIANAKYKVTFFMSGNPVDGRPPGKTMTIDVGGKARAYSYDTSVYGNTFADMKYISESYSFVASPNTDSTTLTFTSTTPGDAGMVLDDIVVSCLSQTGNVGVYSLNDTSAAPGTNAIYKYGYYKDYWKLRKIVVRAPNVHAVAGKTAQTVGWNFTIQKQFCDFGYCGGWFHDYTSPTFKAVTNDATNAPFSDESVGVRAGPFGYDGGYGYRAIIRMFWYRANGSVQGTAKVRVYYYQLTTGSTAEVVTGGCPGWD